MNNKHIHKTIYNRYKINTIIITNIILLKKKNKETCKKQTIISNKNKYIKNYQLKYNKKYKILNNIKKNK